MTKILVTNDDGVQASGMLALVQAMRELGEVAVMAPAVNQSATGHKKTLFETMHVEDVALADGFSARAVHGSPADCVALAALGVGNHWPPDLVVSGINHGANMGQDVTQSGTVSAAFEATIQGIPAVAVSLDSHVANSVKEFEAAAQVAQQVVERVLANRLPPLTVLNVNVPATERIRGIRLVRQGLRYYLDELEQEDGGMYRIVGEPPTGDREEEGTDIWAVHHDYVSLSPIHLDMTAHSFFADLAAWDISLADKSG